MSLHQYQNQITFEHIIKVQELLFIIEIVIVCVLLTVVALGCTPPVLQLRHEREVSC